VAAEDVLRIRSRVRLSKTTAIPSQAIALTKAAMHVVGVVSEMRSAKDKSMGWQVIGAKSMNKKRYKSWLPGDPIPATATVQQQTMSEGPRRGVMAA
jgi:hypothetical protein